MKTLRAERPAGASRFMLCLLVLIIGAATAQAADIPARIYKKGLPNPFQGNARWLKSSQVYKISVKRGNTMQELTIPIDQVVKVQAVKPKALDAAIKSVQGGSFASAIPTLEGIQKQYTMFQWDVPATRWLAEAYMGTKNVDKAYSAVLALKKANPDALQAADFFRIYVKILLAKKLNGPAKTAIDDQIATGGSRESVAMALLLRGDLLMNKGDYKGALIDGYLRTMYFFQNVQAVQPEAMYQAVQCFQKMGDTSKKDKVRKMLLAQYPQSKEARKAKSE